jgi:hypothetical protein
MEGRSSRQKMVVMVIRVAINRVVIQVVILVVIRGEQRRSDRR